MIGDSARLSHPHFLPRGEDKRGKKVSVRKRKGGSSGGDCFCGCLWVEGEKISPSGSTPELRVITHKGSSLRAQ